MGPEVLIGIIVPLGFFAVIFGIFYMRNKENMALIERGINPRNSESRPKPFVVLKYGLLMLGSGTGLLIAYLIDSTLVQHTYRITAEGHKYRTDDNSLLYFSLIAIGGGLGMVISYVIEKKQWLDKRSDVTPLD